MPHYACLGSAWSYCWLSMHANREKKRVKMTSQDLNCSTKIYRVTVPVHDFKCNYDTTAYHNNEHKKRSVRPRGIKLIFMILLRSAKKSYDDSSYSPICLNYICHFFFFFFIWCKLSFSYCLWLYFLCLWPPRTNDESKGNTTANSKSKTICIISHKRVIGKCSSDMLPIWICPCTAAGKMRTVNICICLLVTPHILFLTVKEFLDIVLALNSKVKNDLSELIWVEVYIIPVTENVWDQAVTLNFYLVKIVYYDDWLLYSFFNKTNIHMSNPWLLFYLLHVCRGKRITSHIMVKQAQILPVTTSLISLWQVKHTHTSYIWQKQHILNHNYNDKIENIFI